jgi:hypothetical protein
MESRLFFTLMISNKNYAITLLKNAANDAIAIADNLTNIEFQFSLLKIFRAIL